MKTALFLISLFLLFTASTCERDERCLPKDTYYDFKVPAQIFPAQENYQIGDTIHFVSQFSDQVYEETTNQDYDLQNFLFYPSILVREISNEVIKDTVLNNFEVLVDTSKYTFQEYVYNSGTVSYEGQYHYQNDEYNLEFSIIPSDTGLYYLIFASLSSTIDPFQTFPGKCDKDIYNRVFITVNEEENNNFDLLLESQSSYYSGIVYRESNDELNKNKRGIFLFRVTE